MMQKYALRTSAVNSGEYTHHHVSASSSMKRSDLMTTRTENAATARKKVKISKTVRPSQRRSSFNEKNIETYEEEGKLETYDDLKEK